MTRKTERLEREAEQARGDLAVDLDELRVRLTPGQIVDETVNYARGTAVADFVHNLLREIRENPLPLLLIGAGVAWAAIATSRSRRSLPVPPPLPPVTRTEPAIPAAPAAAGERTQWEVAPLLK